MRYEVLTRTVFGWENMWTDDAEVPTTFATEAEAQAEIDKVIADVKEAVAAGDMEEEYDPADYMVVPVKEEG